MQNKSVKKRTIAVDFDDVLMDFFPSMIDFFNAKENTNHKKEDLKSFYLESIWNCTKEEALDKILHFYELEKDLDLKPIHGSIDAIRKIKEKNNLIVITGRPKHTLKYMQDWLGKHYPGIFDDIFFTNFFFGGKKTKSEICREVGAEIIIDDSLIFIENASEHGVQALLFNAPWNQGELPENVTRVHSWGEILDYLEK